MTADIAGVVDPVMRMSRKVWARGSLVSSGYDDTFSYMSNLFVNRVIVELNFIEIVISNGASKML